MSPPLPPLDLTTLQNARPAQRLQALKDILRPQQEHLHQQHLHGESGLHLARQLSDLVDHLIQAIVALARHDHPQASPLTLLATGGYGRQTLNPGSDIDLLFLTRQPSQKLTPHDREFIGAIQMHLWDLGFQLLPGTRSEVECLNAVSQDPELRTALLDARLLDGSHLEFEKWKKTYRAEAITRHQKAFLEERAQDLRQRRKKYSNTVFLQEPNVKESPGGMRDYHNLIWITDALRGTRQLPEMTRQRLLTVQGAREIQNGIDFLHRVRNALHYRDKKNDILTLRAQGEIVDELGYRQNTLLHRIEAFMRDYYRHTRAIFHHTRSVFEIFDLEQEAEAHNGFFARLPFFGKDLPETRQLGDFTLTDDRLDATDPNLFSRQPNQLLGLFLLTQKHQAHPSPTLRKLIKDHWHLIDRPFRYRKENRETFRALLEEKGKVAVTLRQMHRSGVLGRYLPEFGALDCLVQHEFFHRYTADEHTLRTIEHLDALLENEEPRLQIYRDLFVQHPDPYALFLALLLHDSGRAENVREHIDGSALLASRLCRRLQITGGRQALILFLVDHHLTLWRYATKKDISDPQVITEFANLMRDRHRLDALLLFTYADSRGTNEEAWSPWKESLILQLYQATRHKLVEGEIKGLAPRAEEIEELQQELRERLPERLHPLLDEQFEKMPKRYFRYRSRRNIAHHLRALDEFLTRRQQSPDTPFECALSWVAAPKYGYTELLVVTHDRRLLMEKICCVLAAHRLNIYSAEVYTRTDGTVLDLLRISDEDGKAVQDPSLQESVRQMLYRIHQTKNYDPADYLQTRKNYLQSTPRPLFKFPTRALISNELDPRYTVIELQAQDRLGLLHSLFATLNRHHIQTVHARICTEKGAALDSFYVTTPSFEKITDPATLRELQRDLETIASGSNIATEDLELEEE